MTKATLVQSVAPRGANASEQSGTLQSLKCPVEGGTVLRSRIQGGGGLSGVKAAARNLLLGGAATALMAVTVVGSAAAAPITVTWQPTAVPGITDPYIPALDTPTFSTDDITTAEYGSIVLTPGATTSTFVNQGLVNLSAFTLGGSTTTPVALGRSNGYVLFAMFDAKGTFNGTTVSPAVGATESGVITSFNYNLFIAPANGAAPAFGANSAGPTAANLGSAILLASGSEISNGTTTLSNTASGGLSAGANVVASFIENPAAIADGFYVSPPTDVALNLFSSTTNPGNVLTTPNLDTLVIGANGTGGGGAITFESSVPEPASIAVIGTGIFGLGLLRRRRAKG